MTSARLHLAEAESKPAGRGKLIGLNQLRDVLLLLSAARLHPPPLPEVYELVVDAWTHSVVTPTRQNFSVMDEGVQLFPEDSDLIYADTQLRLKYGLAGDAVALAQFGERYASDPSARERFHRLLATLPSGATNGAGGKPPEK